ncbi:MAG: protein kinase domain-containing protein, partial [Vicinamibacteria bacterium]
MIGRTLSHYQILDEISRGGMGIVYRALDLKLNREVAVKVLPSELVADSDRRRRFVQEAQAAAALNHPHIAVVHEIDEADGVTFMAMELLGGEKLSETLSRGPLPIARALELALGAAEGLARAHDKGIVHRDVKPANLIVTDDGHIKIIDFGLAKLVEPLREPPSEARTAVRGETDAGVILGTVSYMSPEQARGDRVDHRTDVWSLGVVLYEMLTGRAPFQGTSATDTLSAILRDPMPRPPLAGGEELQRILDKCLAKDRNHRYQGMRDLAVDLRAARFRLESGALARTMIPTGRKLWALAAALAVLVIGGLYVSRRAPDLPTRELSGVALRRSVAVVGFKNLSGSADVAWLSTALAEMFTSELAAGEKLRTIPGENVARMKIELRLADAESFGAETLARIRANLGCDLVVLGSYLALGVSGGGKIRLDLRLQDAQMGETVASVSDAGKEEDLLDLVSRTGARLRERLGVGELSPEAAASVGTSLPSNPEAARLYSEALVRLQQFDAKTARDLLEKAVAIEPEHALAQTTLAQAWSLLGFDERANAAAQKAFELSGSLSREMRLLVEARLRETSKEWDQAVEIYRTLFQFFPDNLDYGLRLAEAQTSAGKGNEALTTLEGLRQLPSPASVDPRIDLGEASAAYSLGDYERAQKAAATAAAKAMAHRAPLLAAYARTHEGWAFERLGRYDEATSAADEAKDAFSAAGDRRGVARALAVRQSVL